MNVQLSSILRNVDPAFHAEAISTLRHEVGRRTRNAEKVIPEEKRCPRCGLTRPVEEWGPNAARPDGLQSWCLSCRRVS